MSEDMAEFPMFAILKTAPPTPNVRDGERTPEQKFWDFHERNPDVYESLRDLALDVLASGEVRYSIAGLFEVLRYQRTVSSRQDPHSEFKLNNNYRAYYARLLMTRDRRLVGFFEIRKQRIR